MTGQGPAANSRIHTRGVVIHAGVGTTRRDCGTQALIQKQQRKPKSAWRLHPLRRLRRPRALHEVRAVPHCLREWSTTAERSPWRRHEGKW